MSHRVYNSYQERRIKGSYLLTQEDIEKEFGIKAITSPVSGESVIHLVKNFVKAKAPDKSFRAKLHECTVIKVFEQEARVRFYNGVEKQVKIESLYRKEIA